MKSCLKIKAKPKLKLYILILVLAKNQINRSKFDNKDNSNNKNLDFMPFIQNEINGHVE